MEWKDISSFSKSATDRTPRTFQAVSKDIKIVVTRHIYHDPDAWVLTCTPWYDGYEFCKGVSAGHAQNKAIELVYNKLRNVLASLKYNQI